MDGSEAMDSTSLLVSSFQPLPPTFSIALYCFLPVFVHSSRYFTALVPAHHFFFFFFIIISCWILCPEATREL